MSAFVKKVSVPSRGILFPNFALQLGIEIGKASFPSPLGVSYFQIVVKAATCTEEGTVSVPSRGILFPNALEVWMKNRRNEFPSPLGVSYFQIGWRKSMTRKEKVMGFRPLSGYLISK